MGNESSTHSQDEKSSFHNVLDTASAQATEFVAGRDGRTDVVEVDDLDGLADLLDQRPHPALLDERA